MKHDFISTKKDLQNLWCMAIVALGGRARKQEIVNWIGDLEKVGSISFSDEWRSYWPVELGFAKDEKGFKHLTYNVRSGNQTFWYLSN
tara:strand:+ start:281 stop:544 length:264 start_codon:yes stop_codon:yes gene_type:complete